jgi:Tat protein translocase TatB subunit
MGNIGGPEIIIVLIVALLVLGPNRLPQAARSMGKAMAEFRKVTGGLQAEVRDAMSQLENEVNNTAAPGPPAIPSPPPPAPPATTPEENA